MNSKYEQKIAQEMGFAAKQVNAVLNLLSEGSTVPFIARYRKEATDSLDEVEIAHIRDRSAQLEELDRRREVILKSLRDQEKLTDDLAKKIDEAENLAVLEDLYLPFKPKRRTRASMAKEKGLEPLAQALFDQKRHDLSILAAPYVDPEKEVPSIEDALSGARDIIAEWVSENQRARETMRKLFSDKGTLISKVNSGKEEEGTKYSDYFDWSEPIKTAPSHRILAMRRGENEDILTLRIAPDEIQALNLLEAMFVTGDSTTSDQVKAAVYDSYKRLLCHSMETEIRMASKKAADEEAIRIFAGNLRQLLLSPPLGQKNILAMDPGFRTGCKVVCLDSQGKLLHTDTVFPHTSDLKVRQAGQTLETLCNRFDVDAIAIGNGTAGRETQVFVQGLSLDRKIQVIMVNESGASVYSASEAGREEFPDHDLTVRGAVSIGRRLMDPLAELVKIDPKSIGVGQYQHDVDQKALKKSLDEVVESCVNRVGVEVNTASRQLLTYVSGLGPQLAKNIVRHREENGPFASRTALLNVHRLGAKAFEQAAGFLRINGAKNPLDASAVHPESYSVVETMAMDLKCSVSDLMENETVRKRIRKEKYVTETVGLPTLNDILTELAKPGRDPREQFENIAFKEGIEKIEHLEPGMTLPGVITNIVAFGAFVDIGVHQDGLVHLSQMADHFVKDPNDVIKVYQKVNVRVLNVDLKRKRISLSLKSENTGSGKGLQSNNRKKNAEKKIHLKNREKNPFNNPFGNVLKKIS
ncbi:MAG: RNA-binding transcriptional accessory protein [Deltaproteobacteria bacterium]|nr:RNA-binding transcriptional accessory protein [Deltaproteobacteria bacterium]